jgi:hypothetical protein
MNGRDRECRETDAKNLGHGISGKNRSERVLEPAAIMRRFWEFRTTLNRYFLTSML